VLCYRIVSFWGYLPVGWAAWTAIWWSDRRADARAAEPQPGAAALEPARRDSAAPVAGPGRRDALLPGEPR
jgi:hypothetical protein